MIYLQVSTPIKLSGLQSIKVKFDYNPILVDAIKKYQPAVFHKKLDEIWEIPAYYLSKLLDEFCKLDSISLEISEENAHSNSQEQLTVDEISKFKVRLFNHQIEAINYGLNKSQWLLTHGMGCGKTVTAMSLAEVLHNRNQIEHCLIICAVASLRQNWKKEIQKYSNESCIVLGEKLTKHGKIVYDTVKNRVVQLQNYIKEFFIICNIESLRDDNIIKAIQTGPNKINCIIVDEIHRTNNKSSTQGNNLLKLDAKYKIGMSGTLLVNKPIDLYLPLVWTHNDFSTLTNFKSQYCTYSPAFGHNIITGYKNLEFLKEELDTCSLRKTLNDVVDMPLKNIETEVIEMNDDHAKFYDAIKNGIKEEATKVELNSTNLLSLMTRLRQALVDPSILTDNKISATKLDRCIELIEDLINQKEKVVVFSNFKQPLENIAKRITEYHPLVCTGDYNDDLVNKNVEQFQNNSDASVLLCTHARMGTGFNLNCAAYAVMLDTPYTYSSLDQSICRLYRLNNTRPCYIKILLCKDSIDERIQKIVETKRDLGDFMMDGKLSNDLHKELFNIIKEL